jgi:hypothetical protein
MQPKFEMLYLIFCNFKRNNCEKKSLDQEERSRDGLYVIWPPKINEFIRIYPNHGIQITDT